MSRVGALETSSYTSFYQVPHQDISFLETRLALLEQESAQARAAEGDAIALYDLCFKSNIESKTWLELNAPKNHFGFMIDFHTLMEDVHQQITGCDSLTSLEILYKLRYKT